MVEEPVVKVVKAYLKKLRDHGIDARFGVLYGSQVSGVAGKWSDIDLIVVSPRFDGSRDREDNFLLWRLTAGVDTRIEPIPCGIKEWENDDSRAILEIARREGLRVSPA